MDKEVILKNHILGAGIVEKIRFILSQVDSSDSILDVGCVGQAINKGSNLWLHGVLNGKVKKLVGADIDSSGIGRLVAEGYNMKHVDEIGDEKFDVIVMGDIIEHVADIESFLAFYRSKIKQGGKIIITTPNPFSFRQVLNILTFKRPFINAEHTCFIDPYTMLELLDRSNMKVIDFAWILEHENRKSIVTKTFYLISKIMFSFRKYYSPNFGIVCANKHE